VPLGRLLSPLRQSEKHGGLKEDSDIRVLDLLFPRHGDVDLVQMAEKGCRWEMLEGI
jgi:hypothetical protein